MFHSIWIVTYRNLQLPITHSGVCLMKINRLPVGYGTA